MELPYTITFVAMAGDACSVAWLGASVDYIMPLTALEDFLRLYISTHATAENLQVRRIPHY